MNERQRIEQIMEKEGMNAKQFSQEVGISQGTLSNILGGRNKPSLEVMQQILGRFRSVQSDWLILGVGSMYRPNMGEIQTVAFDIRPEDDTTETIKTQSVEEPKNRMKPTVSERGKVSKVMIFYSDGTFEEIVQS